MPENEFTYLKQKSIPQLNLVDDRFGTTIGNVLAKEGFIKGLSCQITYVLKFDIHGIRIKFVFYSGKEGKWYLNGFSWDDQLAKILEK